MTQSNDFLSIQTPENIVFGYEVAGLGSRFIAAAIDLLIIIVVMVVITFSALFFQGLLGITTDIGEGWILGVSSVLSFLIFWGYYVIFEVVWAGQTPGKRRMGMRTIGRDGAPVGLVASLIRNFVRLIDFVPAFYGLGVMTMFISPRVRRLGDFAAGTLVVFDRNVTLEALTQANQVAAIDDPQGLSIYPVERLSEADIAAAESWLQRRAEISTERQLIRPILQHLYSRMEIELEERLLYDEAIQRLQTIVGRYRNR